MLSKFELMAAFANELINSSDSKNALHISTSDFPVFVIGSLNAKTINGPGWSDEISEHKRFDFIIGDFPLGLWEQESYKIGTKNLKLRQNWIDIAKSIKHLSNDGLAIYVIEPTGFGTFAGGKFKDALNLESYFVKAIFNSPEGLLQPETAINPILVVISKTKTNDIFIGELLNNTQVIDIARNFLAGTIGKDLSQGLTIKEESFYSFQRIKIKQQIERLETQYKEYKKCTIGEIASEINYVKSGHSLIEQSNCVYIPRVGNSPVVSRLCDTTIKHHNYFQVVIGSRAINEYVAAFFRSDLGRLVLQSLASETLISHLNKSALEQATIAIPPLSDQKQIIATQRKLIDLKQAIDSFDSELALNPTSSQTAIAQINSMLEVIGGLTEADEILSIARQGESKFTEFKETLSLDVKKQTKENYIELSALKTIVAFLNTEGGTLLVGVSDDGAILGISNEIDKIRGSSTDKFLLHFKNLLKDRIGAQFYPYIEYNLVKVANNLILAVKCEKSKSPCYLDGSEFYVRTNPATDRLEGPKLVQYVNDHFSGQVTNQTTI